MSRKTQTAKSANTEKQSQKFTHGDLLRKALTWVLNDSMFADVQLHGNLKRTPKQLVILAVLWVWSGRNTLSRAFGFLPCCNMDCRISRISRCWESPLTARAMELTGRFGAANFC
jgi:hypothetical protein